MLTRILIVVALVGLALWMLRRALGRPGQGRPSPPKSPDPSKGSATTETLDLVACHRCGLHLPRTEALWRDNQPFCSEAHASQDRANGGS
ncbi:MAG: PP0621 family protein [Burkholderiaceae bacterium]